MHTFGSLLSERDIPAQIARKVRRAILSHKGLILQLGLANKIDASSYSNNVLPLLGDQYQIFLPDQHKLRWPVYMVPTIAMPELAPPGGSIVEMFPPIRQDLTAEEWSEERKEEVAAQAVERLRSIHEIDIAVRRILSPKEFQNGAHLYAGTLYGLSPLASPATLFKYRSPIRALYQAGQTTWIASCMTLCMQSGCCCPMRRIDSLRSVSPLAVASHLFARRSCGTGRVRGGARS